MRLAPTESDGADELFLYDDAVPAAITVLCQSERADLCRNAWQAAVRLANAIGVAVGVPRLAAQGRVISEDVEERLAAAFPQFHRLRYVMDHITRLPCGTRRFAYRSNGIPFPEVEFEEFLDAVPRVVGEEAECFFRLGLPDFSHPPPDLAALSIRPSVPPEAGQDHVRVRIDFGDANAPAVLQLLVRLDTLIKRLATVPYAAVTSAAVAPPPPPPPPPPAPFLRVVPDRTAPQVILQGTPYRVSPVEAEWVQALLDKDGDWYTSADFAKDHPHRRTFRSDRTIRKLPQALQDLIESQPAVGSRIPRRGK